MCTFHANTPANNVSAILLMATMATSCHFNSLLIIKLCDYSDFTLQKSHNPDKCTNCICEEQLHVNQSFLFIMEQLAL